MPEIQTRPTAEILKDALAGLPKETHLIYIDCNDALSPAECSAIVSGKKDEVVENRDFGDNQENSIDSYLDDVITDADERDALKVSDDFDEFRSLCFERDQSDPLHDLLSNTGSHLVRFYIRTKQGERVAMAEDSWQWDSERVDREAMLLAKAARIDFNANAESLRELVTNATYGGVLCVIAYVQMSDVADWVEHCMHGDQRGRVRLTFTDPHLLLHDSWNGSGHDVDVKGQIVVRFGFGALHATRGVMALDCMGVGSGYSWDDTAAPHKPAYTTKISVHKYTATKISKPDAPATNSWPGR